jgi:hypothetical protein
VRSDDNQALLDAVKHLIKRQNSQDWKIESFVICKLVLDGGSKILSTWIWQRVSKRVRAQTI